MLPFRFEKAATATDAIAAAAAGARYIAGGTTLIDLMREEVERPEWLLERGLRLVRISIRVERPGFEHRAGGEGTRLVHGDRRDVPLSTRAVALFSLIPEGVAVTPAQIDAHWRKARAETDIINLTFHDSRHQAITDLAKKLHVLELAKMVGQRNPKNLLIYFNETATEIAKRLD